MAEEIIIKKAVLHILDNNMTIPILSDKELDIDEETCSFLGKHIEKILNDTNLKEARFIRDNSNIPVICKDLKENIDYFLQAGAAIANLLFDIMVKNVDIAPADLIVSLFHYNAKPYLGILKLNYKAGFTHYVQQIEKGNANTIIRHKTILPSESQKIDECALISLDDFSIKIIEKAYEINGEKEFYLSKFFLHCTAQLSDNEKVKILNKVTRKINKKFFDEDFEMVAKLKKAVSENLEETSTIQVDTLVEEVFGNNIEIQNEYISEVEKAGLNEKTIPIPEKLVERNFKTHKIKTDTGIEINFPLNYYDNKEKIEFINNPDGTVSIIIKNIGKIINK